MLDVRTLIPHAPPMLFVDRIVEFDAVQKYMLASKLIAYDEHFVQGHYPGFPIVPGVVTCECIFQTGAALLAALEKQGVLTPLATNQGVPVVARANNVRFKGLVKPGDQLILRAELVDHLSSAFHLKGFARVNDELRVTLDFSCMFLPISV